MKGVLAIQGDFAAHGRMLEQLGETWREVRAPKDLEGIDGLVMPGGESTTMLRCFQDAGLEAPIVEFAQRGGPILATCAGAILLAKEVLHPPQHSLGLVDVTIERNAYGRQVDSFIANVPCPSLGPEPLELVFIRAPIVRRLGGGVKVLAEQDGKPVLMQQGDQYLLATFHPELTTDLRIHRRFCELSVKSEEYEDESGS